jgi:hypothetical protein
METEKASLNAKIALSMAMFLALAACQQGAEVTVQQNENSVNVSATLRSGRDPACITELTLYKDNSDVPLWNVVAFPDGKCTNSLVIAHEPVWFSADDGMKPPHIVEGNLYRVDVSGHGFSGSTNFRALRSLAL